jgi:hypothetical protein
MNYHCNFRIRAIPCPFWDKGNELDALAAIVALTPPS